MEPTAQQIITIIRDTAAEIGLDETMPYRERFACIKVLQILADSLEKAYAKPSKSSVESEH